jgi:nucleotide-binding universal stress UspA family protein
VDRVAVGGEITRTVLAGVDERTADCIVIGGRTRSGGQEGIIGSFAHDLMLSAERPVTPTW